MCKAPRIFLFAAALLATISTRPQSARADDASATVSYPTGETLIGVLHDGIRFFTNRVYTLGKMPPELDGLKFTFREGGGKDADVEFHVRPGATVYLLVDNGKTTGRTGGLRDQMFQHFQDGGWTRLDEIPQKPAHNVEVPAVFKKQFGAESNFTLHAVGYTGIVVAARDLAAGPNKNPPPKKNGDTPPSDKSDNIRVRPPADNKPMRGPAVRVINQQATIKTMAVLESSGRPVGGAVNDCILTVTTGDASHLVTLNFITPIGDQLAGVVDDVLRYEHVKYPNWYADHADITFDDHVDKDGPSIGAAIGTLLRSTIEGFQIDDQAAITGDFAANGRVHAIGGLLYKLRGAASVHCSIAAVPSDNFDNLIDAVIYKGPSVASDVQVIGMHDLDDAVAVMRTDRDAKLTQAISIFSQVQQSLQSDPRALSSLQTQAQLSEVLSLAPNHLSARVLLMLADKKLPRRLSAAASFHYIHQTSGVMASILKERAALTVLTREHSVPSSAVQEQLAELERLRPLVDAKIVPYLDAWERFIRCYNALLAGGGTADAYNAAYEKLLDIAATMDADPELNQRRVTEGM